MSEIQKRQVAKKIAIGKIVDAAYTKTEGLNPNYLEIGAEQVARVNVVGAIVQKSEGTQPSLVIEDSSGSIAARSFDNPVLTSAVNVGDIVLLIGRPREYGGEKYVLIEACKKVDPLWAQVRLKELGSAPKSEVVEQALEETPEIEEIKEEAISESSPKTAILEKIKQLDFGEGVAVEDLQAPDDVIDLLLKEGDVFEIKPGKLKVLE